MIYLLAVGFRVAALAPFHPLALQDSDYAISRASAKSRALRCRCLFLYGLHLPGS